MIKKAKKKKKKWKWNLLLLLMLMLFIKIIIGQKWRNGNIEAVKFVVVVFNAYIVALVEIEDVTKLKLYLVEFTQVLSASTAAQPTLAHKQPLTREQESESYKQHMMIMMLQIDARRYCRSKPFPVSFQACV